MYVPKKFLVYTLKKNYYKRTALFIHKFFAIITSNTTLTKDRIRALRIEDKQKKFPVRHYF
jgi:hypothetical protein